MPAWRAVPVEFKGQRFVWLKQPGDVGPLVHPEAVTVEGRIVGGENAINAYAHVSSGGVIHRHQKEIGRLSDLRIFG